MPEYSAADGPAGSRPLAEDALRLVSSMQDWAQDWAHDWAQRNRSEQTGRHVAADCQWCPLCQFVAVLRGERPEVTERIAEAGTALVAAVRAMAEAASSGAADGPQREPRRPASARVQKINLGDEA
jgi:hypothetical protein